MSSADLNAFENQLSLLSYAEQLSIIEFLVNLLKNRHEETPVAKQETASQKNFCYDGCKSCIFKWRKVDSRGIV